MRIIVIGCGIGGACLSLALDGLGLDHVVLEQAPELTEVGAGLQLSPNAVRVLERLGLEEDLRRFGVPPQAHVFRDGLNGELLLETPLMPLVEETFGAPYFHAHRADLLAALTVRLGTGRVRLGATVAAVHQDESGVRAELADGSVERGDVLIGADGIHSLVRAHLFPDEAPRQSGCVAWRGLVPVETARDLGLEQNSMVWMGPERSVVMYYVAGGTRFNWVGIGPFNANARESWSARGSNKAALEEYAGWQPVLRELIAATDSLFMTSLFDRDPLEHWVAGRMALMGDAAHAMMPFHAQGAGQSIEDAWVLARCLAEAGGPAAASTALHRYQDLRLERANRVQAQSRSAEHLFHMSDPDDIARRNARFARHRNRGGFPQQQRWLFSYDAERAVTGEDADWRAMAWS